LLRTGIVAAGADADCAARLMTIGCPGAAFGIGAGGAWGAVAGAEAMSAGGTGGDVTAGGVSGCHTPGGRPAGDTPCRAAFRKRLQISTGRLPPDAFFVGEPSSLPSQTPATR